MKPEETWYIVTPEGLDQLWQWSDCTDLYLKGKGRLATMELYREHLHGEKLAEDVAIREYPEYFV